ncbi:Crp/Fnr family transcriptional regulator [Niameybacter massiliensis]|uniref:Crp/Fnr family transcriptional regulator n=1 Tax=Holtiella tumoricola TaxID=3018743 RepID=A0AA42DKM7_9FIRM|nr:Crp/Fnr family transcriptional regulator [Holtiella tumoricola]MDA3730762.1 Crp/Fnr family transcriptional regulator [Holtiella tumoricola]
MTKVIEAVQKSVLFNEIDTIYTESLLGCLNLKTKKYNEGEFIIRLHSVIEEVSIVVEGEVEIIKENRAGDRMIVGVLGTGEIFGEGIVCTKKRMSPVSVRAKTNTEVAFIPYEKILMTCGESCGFHKQLIRNMLYVLGEKNYHLNQKIDYLILKGMREKLALYLLEQSYKEGQRAFNIPLNRNDLAEYLNVSRSAMSRELSRMKDEGLIDFYKNSFKICNEVELKNYLR